MNGKRGPIGVAVGSRRITAVIGEGKSAYDLSVPFAMPIEGGDTRATLALAFEALRDRIARTDTDDPKGSTPNADADTASGLRGAWITIAVLPPLSETKLLRLPPLRADEAEEVLRRNAAQHFLTGGAPSVVAVESVASAPIPAPSGVGEESAARGSAGPVPPARPASPAGLHVMASAAPRALAEAIYDAVTAVGWNVERIVPAQAAWLSALRSGGGPDGRAAPGGAPRVLVALSEGAAHVLRLEGERPVSVRRIASPSPDEVLEAAGAGPGRFWVLGAPVEARDVQGALARAGWQAGPTGEVVGAPDRVAAAWASRTDVEMVPPRLAMERRDRVRRIARRMAMAAAVLVFAAAGIQLWGAFREVASLRERRAEIRGSVQPVLAVEGDLLETLDRLDAIDAVRGDATGWTFTLVELSMVLPESVHLVGLQAAGDTLVIEAIGQRAGDALDALRRASSIRDVRQEGTTQYELEDGAIANERFTLSAVRVRGAAGAAGGTAPGAGAALPAAGGTR